jgi:hypothetical protein
MFHIRLIGTMNISSLPIALLLLLATPALFAAESFEVVSGRQGVLTGRIDGRSVMARACRSPGDCSAELRIAIPAEADAARAKSERIDLPGGKKVVLVSAPAQRGGGRWVLLLAAKSEGPSVEKLLVGFVERPKGELEGERKTSVLLHEDEVLVLGHQYENASICGRPALINARQLDPDTLSWKPTTTRSLGDGERASAPRLTARRLEEPFALDQPQLLHAVVASSAIGRDQSGLTDSKLDTRWAEGWHGDGRGEFVVLNASRSVPITGFELVVRPTGDPEVKGAAPKELFVATDDALFQIVLPEDAWLQEPGTAYRVDLPQRIRTDCVTVVLDSRYPRGDDAPLTLAELRAVTSHEGRGGDFGALVKELDAESTRADAATALLLRSGERALAATLAAYAGLSPAGQRRALAVIDGGSCDKTVGFFVDRLLGKGHLGEFDPSLDRVAQHAIERLRLCRIEATEALAKAMEVEKGTARVWVARQLAAIAPARAVASIASRIDVPDSDERRGLRSALALAAKQPRARQALLAELGRERFASRSLVTRIDLLRALDAEIGKLEPARAAFAQVLASDGTFRTRYLLQGPAAELAQRGDASALAFLRQSLRSDESHHVRAHAARASGGVPQLAGDVARALRDAQPRVREAALEALAMDRRASAAATEAQVIALLRRDPWTFVRVGAARALAQKPSSPKSDAALMEAVKDDALARVRAAAIEALGKRKSTAAAELVHDVAGDAQEPLTVRVAAVIALGDMCRRDSAPLLYKLALRAGFPELAYDQPLGMAALAALGAIKPPDLAPKLAPLLSRSQRVPRVVRMVARDVLIRPGSCR